MAETGVRKSFSQQLQEMQEELLAMGRAVEVMLEQSVQALKEQNVALAEDVVASDDVVDRYNLDIETRALQLLALQQPMAGDLRQIAAALKIIGDVERVGDYCVDIAKIAITLAGEPYMKPLIDIPKMAEAARQMLRQALEAFVKRDLELVQFMIDNDDQVDHFYHAIFNELVQLVEQKPEYTSQAMHLLLLARYLERIADHITNIGERVFYMVTGEIKELHT